MDSVPVEELERASEKAFEELIAHQEKKLMRLATELRPNVTSDDLLQPQDIPEIANDPQFNYEDGLLAGIKAARIAFRARVLVPFREAKG